MNEVPRYTVDAVVRTLMLNGNTLNRFQGFCLQAKARIWHGLPFMCHIRSTEYRPHTAVHGGRTQLHLKIVNSLFTITDSNINLTILQGS